MTNRKIKLLLLNDNADNLTCWHSYLEGGGLSVEIASTWATAQKKLDNDHFDLMVCDVVMPPGKGYVPSPNYDNSSKVEGALGLDFIAMNAPKVRFVGVASGRHSQLPYLGNNVTRIHPAAKGMIEAWANSKIKEIETGLPDEQVERKIAKINSRLTERLTEDACTIVRRGIEKSEQTGKKPKKRSKESYLNSGGYTHDERYFADKVKLKGKPKEIGRGGGDYD
ncbi:MAG: response regulator [Alphaproteobacteria bacterium]|nr:response regulator [Alphaproteobacteria bacterium]